MRKILCVIGICLMMAGLVANDVSMIAEPRRAIENEGWKNNTFADKDYWQIYEASYMTRAMPSIKNMPFYKHSGRYLFRVSGKGIGGGGIVDKKNNIYNAIAIREIKLKDTTGHENIAGKATFKVVEPIPESTHYNLAYINDGDDWTTFQYRGNRSPETKLGTPRMTLGISLDAPTELTEITLESGAYLNVGLLQKAKVFISENGTWKAIPVNTRINGKRTMVLTPTKPVNVDKLRLELTGYPYLIVFNADKVPDKEYLKKHPFCLQMARVIGCVDSLSLTEENIDKKSFQGFLKEFENTNMGLQMNEWDSNMKSFIYLRPNYQGIMPTYLKEFKTKEEGRKAWERFFKNWQGLLFNQVLAQSGNVAYSQYAAAWGAKNITMECSGMSTLLPVRSMFLVSRGGARQFGIPWGFYQAFFYGIPHCTQEFPEEGKGISQTRRELFTSYYMGANYHWPEAPGHSMFKKKDDNVTLSDNGKLYRWFYRWHNSEKGQRGESYTPILFLIDYDSGHSGRRWSPRFNFTCWDKIPFDDGDYMQEHFIRTVDKRLETDDMDVMIIPPYSNNLRNSKVGDICDIFFANPPQHGGAIKEEHLQKYPVVVLLGDIKMNDALAKRLKDYVAKGGTLVINVAQLKGAFADSSFTGLDILDEKVSDSVFLNYYSHRDYKMKPPVSRKRIRYPIIKVKPKTAKVVKKSAHGYPLFLVNKAGKGNVVVATPYFMLSNDPKVANPLIEELLVALQDELLPIRVDGDLQFLMNKLAPDHWRVTVINNKGILKHPQSPEMKIRMYETDVTLTAPEGAIAEEITKGETLRTSTNNSKTTFSFRLEPGEVRVVDVKNVKN